MLWYGYIYYMIFNVFLLSTVFYLLRMFFINSLVRINTYLVINRFFLSIISFILFIMIVTMNSSLSYYSDSVFIDSSGISYLGTFSFANIINLTALNLNLVQVYTYPFIYVFLLVTVLSIIFCLSYNTDELMSFMLYCMVILTAGYTLFFTDSLILFFLAYEMLLVPSFFILYKFAKTRRCVEAAYLMFFWTQFGALFLIFGFVYMFIVADTSTFSSVALIYFSQFEVNFIFLCVLIGFGVKLPI